MKSVKSFAEFAFIVGTLFVGIPAAAYAASVLLVSILIN